MLRLLPAIFIVISFLAICIGAYLKVHSHPAANFVIICGIVGETTFILFNRMMMSKSKKDDR